MHRLAIGPTEKGTAALAVEAASRYSAKLRRYLDRRLRKYQDVDDLEQEVYMRLLQADCPKDLKNPLAFIYTVASRVIGDYWRDANSKTEQMHSTAPHVQVILDGTSDPTADLEEKLSAEQTVRLALQDLSPMHAAILVLIDRDQMSHTEAALELGISVHTVKKYLTQARSSLRKKVCGWNSRMSTSNLKFMDLTEQAAYWVDHYDPEVHREAFYAWLQTSPEHVKEFMAAARLIELTRSFDPEKQVDVQALIKQAKHDVLPVKPHVTSSRRRSDMTVIRQSPVRAIAVAASILAAIAAMLGYYFFEKSRYTYATDSGEQNIVTLDDGSIVQINSHSRLQIRYSETTRDIYLTEGQAAFKVRRDIARPFRVYANSAVIQALGTQFDVRLAAERTLLAVVEGAVQVSANKPSSAAPKISAGEGTIIEAGGKVAAVQRVDAAAISDWQQRLKFLDTPLDEIAAAFNRYNITPQIRIEGDVLKKRPFSGNFSAHRVDSLLTTLAPAGLTFERDKDEIVIRVNPQ